MAALAAGGAGFHLAYRELNAFLLDGGGARELAQGVAGAALLALAVAGLGRVISRL